MVTLNLDPTYTFEEIIGLLIAKHRNTLSINQGNMAKKLGMSQVNLSRIEHGKINLTIKNLIKICEILDILPSEFFQEVELAERAIKWRKHNVWKSP